MNLKTIDEQYKTLRTLAFYFNIIKALNESPNKRLYGLSFYFRKQGLKYTPQQLANRLQQLRKYNLVTSPGRGKGEVNTINVEKIEKIVNAIAKI